jgi:tetratricopeptide (TPR) repeat protein
LQQYERFESDPQYLDSARVLLAALPADELGAERTNWYYLSNQAGAFATWVGRRGTEHWLRTWSRASLDNQHAWACAKAAQMLEALGRTGEAEALYRQSLKLAPEIPAIRQKWGTFLAKLGRTAEAEAEFASVLQMQPLNAEASSNLGYLMAQRAAHAEADAQFRAAICSNPLYVRARVNQIQSWIQQGRWSEALHALNQAQRIVPNHPELNQLSKLIGR